MPIERSVIDYGKDEQVKLVISWFTHFGENHVGVVIGERTTVYLRHSQLMDMRDELNRALMASPVKCQHPDCGCNCIVKSVDAFDSGALSHV